MIKKGKKIIITLFLQKLCCGGLIFGDAFSIQSQCALKQVFSLKINCTNQISKQKVQSGCDQVLVKEQRSCKGTLLLLMLSEFKSQRRYQSWIEICYLINLLFVPKGFCLGRPVFTSPQNLLIPKSIFNSQTFSCEFLKARVLWACKQTALFTIHFSASHVLKYLTRERAF